MELEKFMKNIEKLNGNRKYLIFKTMVCSLLEKYLKQQGKEFEKNSLTGVDVYAAQGIDDLESPTGIEVKFATLNLDKISESFKQNAEKKINSYLIIVAYDPSAEEKALKCAILKQRLGMNVTIWGLSELKTKIKECKYELSSNDDENVSKEYVETTIKENIDQKDENVWKDKRNSYITNLHNEYEGDNLVLFLGSGVSKSCGIPKKDELITDLFVTLVSNKINSGNVKISPKDREYLINEINKQKDSGSLLETSFIRNGLGNEFIQEVPKALYKNVNKSGLASEPLKSITKLCLPKRFGIGIRAVVTYNYDDLTEEAFNEVGIEYKTVVKENDYPDESKLGVYHINGFIPRSHKDNLNSINNVLAFSEDEYQDPYAWSIMTQLNFLRDNSCLFIGSSLNNPKLRRLLEISSTKGEGQKHYAILKKPSIESTEENKKVCAAFLKANENIQEQTMMELGVNVIWIEDEKEIPEILDKVKSGLI